MILIGWIWQFSPITNGRGCNFRPIGCHWCLGWLALKLILIISLINEVVIFYQNQWRQIFLCFNRRNLWLIFVLVNKLAVSLSVCLSVSQSVCLYVCLSVSQSVSLSVCMSVCLSVRLSVCLCVWLFVCPLFVFGDLSVCSIQIVCKDEGGVVIEVNRAVENFYFWPKMPIFDTSHVFIIQFQLQRTLYKNTKRLRKTHSPPNVPL